MLQFESSVCLELLFPNKVKPPALKWTPISALRNDCYVYDVFKGDCRFIQGVPKSVPVLNFNNLRNSGQK